MTILELLKAGRERVEGDKSDRDHSLAEVTLLGAIIEAAAEKSLANFSQVEKLAVMLLTEMAHEWDREHNGGTDVSSKSRRLAIYDLALAKIGATDAKAS